MKKKGFRSVRRNKRRTVQTGGGHDELITSILLEDLPGVQTNIANLQPNEKNAEAQSNELFTFAVGRTELYLACRLPNPNPGIVTLLLDNGFSPNSRNNVHEKLGNGAYPLHGVVESIKDNLKKDGIADPSSYVDIIRLLKDKGADLEVKNSSKRRDGSVGMTAYDEYVGDVKRTTEMFYRSFDVELNNALFPYLPSLSRRDQRGALIYVPPPVEPTPPVLMPPRMRPAYAAAAAAAVRPTGPPPLVPPSHTAHGAAVRPPVVSPTGSHGQAPSGSITIQPTQSLRVISDWAWFPNTGSPQIYSSRNDTDIVPKNAFVLCPEHIVTAFRSLPGIQKCIKMSFNPYNLEQPIILPANIAEFNGKHLQVLARNESVNTDGIMKTSLYGGVLTVEEIATIRCLVKNTTVVGITYPEKTGGYGGPNPPPAKELDGNSKRKPTIIVDQCGLQWQNSIYNTGALFFYPTRPEIIFEGTDDTQSTHTTLGKYRQWQNDTYLKMYGEDRPPVDDATDLDATWVIQDKHNKVRLTLVGKLKSPVVGFKTEFMQAFESVRLMADTPIIKNVVHFKFLRAGLGFFSENILLTGDQMGIDANGLTLAPKRTKFLETARLQGICEGISQLGHGRVVDGAPHIMKHTKIKRIILPFQTVRIPQMDSLNMYLVTNNEDALAQHPDPDVTIATTNCADPHAGPGNEGGYQSVDAAIASNTYVHHLNAAFNYANIQSITFEDIGPVVPPVHVQPSAAYESPLLPGQVFHSPPSTAAAPPPAYPPPGGAAAAVYSPAAVDQTQNIMIQKGTGSAEWISAPQSKYLWDIYLSDPTGIGYREGWNHPRPNYHIMIDPNSNKVMLKFNDKEIGIMDVNDIKVYLIGPSLPSQPADQPPLEPGWYPASDYHKYAYLDFMYNTDQPQQSRGVTYLASQDSTNYSHRQPHHRLIKNFNGDIFNSDDLIVFTMIRLPDRRIYYQKNDLRGTLVFISGIPMEMEAYKLQMDQRLSEARQMWSNRPQPPQPQPPAVPALPDSPLPPIVAAPMAVAPIRPIRTPYRGRPVPAGSPPFPLWLLADVKAGDNDRRCLICVENKPNLKFMPCNHCIYCIECYIDPNNTTRSICPTCRTPVESLALCDDDGDEFQPNQQGCLGPFCKWFDARFSRNNRVAPGNGGKNKNRKQQKLQKQKKQRATRKHKNKKQSRRRDQRHPRHIRGHGSRKSS